MTLEPIEKIPNEVEVKSPSDDDKKKKKEATPSVGILDLVNTFVFENQKEKQKKMLNLLVSVFYYL